MADRTYPANPATVELQDLTNEIIDLKMVRSTGDITLAVAGVLGAGTVTLEAGHGVTNGDIICLKSGPRFYQGIVTNVSTNIITLTAPLDYAFPITSTGQKASAQLAVNGSVTPVVFSLAPATESGWHVTGIMFELTDATAMDDTLFGGVTALTKGVVVRKKDGTYKNLFTLRSNADFQVTCQTTSYADKAGAGSYGFRAYKDFSIQHGVVVSLDGATADELEIIVQDDLTGLTNFRVNLVGHVMVP